MRYYKFIIVRDDGKQREAKVKWDRKVALDFQEDCGLSMEEEVAKCIGRELAREIANWEKEE